MVCRGARFLSESHLVIRGVSKVMCYQHHSCVVATSTKPVLLLLPPVIKPVVDPIQVIVKTPHHGMVSFK